MHSSKQPDGLRVMIPISELPWDSVRTEIVAVDFLPAAAVKSPVHEAWKAAETASRRKVRREDYEISKAALRAKKENHAYPVDAHKH